MSIRRDLALSLILGLRNVHAVLCHLFRCFDPRFKENIHCHPVFIIRDINSCRKGYLKDRLKSWESDHFNIQFVIPSQTLTNTPPCPPPFLTWTLKSQRLLPLILRLRRVLLHALYRLMSTKMTEWFVVCFVRNLYPITLTTVIALPGF